MNLVQNISGSLRYVNDGKRSSCQDFIDKLVAHVTLRVLMRCIVQFDRHYRRKIFVTNNKIDLLSIDSAYVCLAGAGFFDVNQFSQPHLRKNGVFGCESAKNFVERALRGGEKIVAARIRKNARLRPPPFGSFCGRRFVAQNDEETEASKNRNPYKGQIEHL